MSETNLNFFEWPLDITVLNPNPCKTHYLVSIAYITFPLGWDANPLQVTHLQLSGPEQCGMKCFDQKHNTPPPNSAIKTMILRSSVQQFNLWTVCLHVFMFFFLFISISYNDLIPLEIFFLSAKLYNPVMKYRKEKLSCFIESAWNICNFVNLNPHIFALS